jgi:hypothetical protein
MEAIPLCLLLKEPHLFSLTQRIFTLTQLLPLHVRYMLRLVFRPSSGMSTQKA